MKLTSRIVNLGIVLCAFISQTACAIMQNEVADNTEISSKIDTYIEQVMEADAIPGMAIAVVRNDTILHKKYYGLANIEHSVPVSDSTIFRVYSTTKLITSVGIFQLIEDGRLKLEDPLSLYFDSIPDSWRNIRVKHLLSHSSGLPDFTALKDQTSLSNSEIWERLFSQDLHFEKGGYYEYNQTGFWLLKQIIEKITEKPFDQYILDHQFSQPGSTTFFASNSLVSYPNRVAKYTYSSDEQRYKVSTFAAGNRSIAGNGLNVTLSEMIEWNRKLDANLLLTSETQVSMRSQFPYEKDTRASFAYGWDRYSVNGQMSYGFSGGGVSDFKKFDNGLTVILLSNGYKYRPRMANIMRFVVGLVEPSLNDIDRNAAEEVRLAFLGHPYNKAYDLYDKIKDEYPNTTFEAMLNLIGYDLLSVGNIAKAIKVFELNALEHPDLWNCFDSLGEAHFLNGDEESARLNYNKSLELNPENTNAVKMLEKL